MKHLHDVKNSNEPVGFAQWLKDLYPDEPRTMRWQTAAPDMLMTTQRFNAIRERIADRTFYPVVPPQMTAVYWDEPAPTAATPTIQVDTIGALVGRLNGRLNLLRRNAIPLEGYALAVTADELYALRGAGYVHPHYDDRQTLMYQGVPITVVRL